MAGNEIANNEFTQLEKNAGQIREGLERLENKMESAIEQLWTDLRSFHTKMTKMFDEMLARIKHMNTSKQVIDYAVDMKTNHQT